MRAALGLASVGTAGAVGTGLLDYRSRSRHVDVRERQRLDDYEHPGAEDCAQSLEDEGIAIVPHALSAVQVAACLRMESHTDSYRYTTLQAHYVPGTGGRWHRRTFPPADSRALTSFEEAWEPTVCQYMGKGTKRSDLQLLVSEPGSKAQFFHQDNRRRSLTVVVPLVDVDVSMGPTQLLPGSHRCTAPTSQACTQGPVIDCDLQAALPPGRDRSLRACIPAGYAMIYDSRVLHRGLGNQTRERPRPMLVYRYDTAADPAPGHGVVSTAWFRVVGKLACAAAELRAVLMT